MAESAAFAGPLRQTGNGPTLQPIDIGHRDLVALVDPDTAFWSLAARDKFADVLSGVPLLAATTKKFKASPARCTCCGFGLKPSAVYFNPTERCNLNCTYCYIPEAMRRSGKQMTAQMLDALGGCTALFPRPRPKGRLPQIVFHGAEPLLEPRSRLRRHREFGERLPFRRADQRHAAR